MTGVGVEPKTLRPLLLIRISLLLRAFPPLLTSCTDLRRFDPALVSFLAREAR